MATYTRILKSLRGPTATEYVAVVGLIALIVYNIYVTVTAPAS
jgi:type IV secretory pathway VirB2 component (pilin)